MYCVQITLAIPDIKDDFFSRPSPGQPEAKILDVFCTYCGDGTITKHILVKILKLAHILDATYPKRTISDCKLAFTKATLLAKTRGCYQSGVIAKKFMAYRVFREVLMSCLAERFSCSTEKLLEALRKVCKPSSVMPTTSIIPQHSFHSHTNHAYIYIDAVE